MALNPSQRSWRLILLDLGEFVVELVKVVLVSLAIIFPIRYYIAQPFYVKGASMEPSFFDHEYLVIDEISYRFHPPARGDVVVFHYPRDPRQFFIKRVIGLPGESIHIHDGGVNVSTATAPSEVRLREPYLDPAAVTSGDVTVTVGNDQYFLLGDNRPASLDSRVFGPVPARYVVGRVWLRAWPFSRWTIFSQSTASPAVPTP